MSDGRLCHAAGPETENTRLPMLTDDDDRQQRIIERLVRRLDGWMTGIGRQYSKSSENNCICRCRVQYRAPNDINTAF